MTPGVRAVRPPRPVALCWALAVALGGTLVLNAPAHGQPGGGQPDSGQPGGALGPATLSSWLRRDLPVGSRSVVLQGVYGSAHAGHWQFLVHLAWSGPTGVEAGGTLVLPGPAGNPVLTPDAFGAPATGWTLDELSRALGRTGTTTDPLALVDLETAEASFGLVYCHGEEAAAACTSTAADGRRLATFTTGLADNPDLDATAVSVADTTRSTGV